MTHLLRTFLCCAQASEQERMALSPRSRSGNAEAALPLRSSLAAGVPGGAGARRSRCVQLEAGSPSGSAPLSDDGSLPREGRLTAEGAGMVMRRVRISEDAATASPRQGRSPRIGMFEESLRGSTSLQGARCPSPHTASSGGRDWQHCTDSLQ